jgi:hypothetical protein
MIRDVIEDKLSNEIESLDFIVLCKNEFNIGFPLKMMFNLLFKIYYKLIF